MSISKRYSVEFKIEAIKQVAEKGHSVAEVALRLGTTTHSLYVWIKRYAPITIHESHLDVDRYMLKASTQVLFLNVHEDSPHDIARSFGALF